MQIKGVSKVCGRAEAQFKRACTTAGGRLIAGIDLLTIASVIRLASAIQARDNHQP
jgi:hypothetical protein